MTDAQAHVLRYKLQRLLNATRVLYDRTLDTREYVIYREAMKAIEGALSTIAEPVKILVI